MFADQIRIIEKKKEESKRMKLSLQSNNQEIMKDVKIILKGVLEIETVKENLITDINIEAKNFGELIKKLSSHFLDFALITLKDCLELIINFEEKKNEGSEVVGRF